ncbi:hypothetical protein [Vibrio navarrensis]|uniref:hypothetical protein n=1 Tax=Vibrio navarrensis TaxID=29495 RepID=UPI00186A2BD2|nr:hypothetical protein [Vibrio navarrensis]MBE4618166.1 hypothetical protein [Vibrio navarrensis]
MRFESVHQDVISFERFVWRCVRYALIALLVLLIGLMPGIGGFVWITGLSVEQALLNALSMVSGLELPYPVADLLESTATHLFLALYSLFIEGVFFAALATLFAPAIHRLFHRLHCEPTD